MKSAWDSGKGIGKIVILSELFERIIRSARSHANPRSSGPLIPSKPAEGGPD
jgi:hypothetical protein